MNSNKIHTETILLELYRHLVSDLDPEHAEWYQPRNFTGPNPRSAGPYTMKAIVQLRDFFKRVILSSDRSLAEIDAQSIRDFWSFQTSHGLPETEKGSVAYRVLERARSIVQEILGDFSFDEFAAACSFGKKAAVGLKLRDSYLDKRVEHLSYSGDQLEWFKAVLSQDIRLHRCVRKHLKRCPTRVDALTVVAVPKSFKVSRIIAPDTVVGGFLSRGLGVVLQNRLKNGSCRIDITAAQDIHRNLAHKASLDGSYATLDMSRASDSFTWDHIKALVPESWHSVLRAIRTDCAYWNDGDTEVPVELNSFMLMGSGHTFPLQTLLFYAISKAVTELLKSSCRVYVYGDDILVPSRFAEYVVGSLEKLGFTLNREKSFWDGIFRESCGGDYCLGVDVRPYLPEHIATEVSPLELLALVHQWANGLVQRWGIYGCSNALDYLYSVAASLSKGRVYHVPADFPDYSGFRSLPIWWHPACFHRSWGDDQVERIPHLKMRSKKRKILNGHPYYWKWLATSSRQQRLVDPYDTEVSCSFGTEGKKGTDREFRRSH